MFFAIFWSIRHCNLRFFLNSFGYMQEPALNRILACVAKWKIYSRIFNTSFVNTPEIRLSEVLCNILNHSSLRLVDFQQLSPYSWWRSRPYSRLCGKIKVLLSHFQYFFSVSTTQIKVSQMFFCDILTDSSLWLVRLPTVRLQLCSR